MLLSLLLALLPSVHIWAQTALEDCNFVPTGCAHVDLSCFGDPVVFSHGIVSPDTCQLACQGHLLAILLPDGCRCGDDQTAITPANESLCNVPCMDDPALGICGGICPDGSSDIADVFLNANVLPVEDVVPAAPETTQLSSSSVENPVPIIGSPNVMSSPAASATEPPTNFVPEMPGPEIPLVEVTSSVSIPSETTEPGHFGWPMGKANETSQEDPASPSPSRVSTSDSSFVQTSRLLGVAIMFWGVLF